MRVLVTGSRTWTDPVPIRGALGDLAAVHPTITVVHGGATGADAIAAQWVADRRREGCTGIQEERHPADWKRHGRRAGILRNIEMVRRGADVCLAFIRDNSRGAMHCARTAAAAGVETWIFRWPAEVTP